MQAHGLSPGVARSDGEPALNEVAHGLGPPEVLERLPTDGAGDGQHLEDSTGVVGDRREAALDQLDQPRGHREGLDLPPEAILAGDLILLEGRHEHLAQVERVAVGGAPEGLDQRAVGLAAEEVPDQPADVAATQGVEGDGQGRPVVHDAGERWSDVLTVPDAEQEASGAVEGELVDERRRRVIEELGVVHREHDRLSVAHLRDRGRRSPEEPDDAVGEQIVDREQRRQGTERDGRRRTGGGDSGDERSRAGRPRGHLGDEAGLADAGGTADHHGARR